MSVKNINIYVLIDPTNNSPFYVGATKKPIKYRLAEHINGTCGKVGVLKEKLDRIASIIAAGVRPQIKLLKKVSEDEVNKYESMYAWKFQNSGYEMIQMSRFNYKKPVKEKDNGSIKRVVKGYKIQDSVYQKALKRASKEKGALAKLIENVVTCYAYGMNIHAVKYSPGEATSTALDIFDLKAEIPIK